MAVHASPDGNQGRVGFFVEGEALHASRTRDQGRVGFFVEGEALMRLPYAGHANLSHAYYPNGHSTRRGRY